MTVLLPVHIASVVAAHSIPLGQQVRRSGQHMALAKGQHPKMRSDPPELQSVCWYSQFMKGSGFSGTFVAGTIFFWRLGASCCCFSGALSRSGSN